MVCSFECFDRIIAFLTGLLWFNADFNLALFYPYILQTCICIFYSFIMPTHTMHTGANAAFGLLCLSDCQSVSLSQNSELWSYSTGEIRASGFLAKNIFL